MNASNGSAKYTRLPTARDRNPGRKLPRPETNEPPDGERRDHLGDRKNNSFEMT